MDQNLSNCNHSWMTIYVGHFTIVSSLRLEETFQLTDCKSELYGFELATFSCV
ncbi:hypothetical protein AKJ16_DCAP20317 [Drosera capensis]